MNRWPERRVCLHRGQAAVANIKSQIKRNRQTEKRNARNRAIRAELRTRTKNVLESAEAGSDDTEENLRLAIKRIDMAVTKGTMHKNTAARTKSRLTKRVRSLHAS
ncbi:MAG: small subunit ribosomal protein S20 [Verrucomicrobiales bacterium]|jgi:small subunit ribosomal protein S20